MEITSVRFESFKSLYDVACHLDHLTVITGPNGAGKSNFVDALSFIGEVYEDGLEFAVSRAGGYDNIAHRRTRRAKRPIRITVKLSITKEDLTTGPYVELLLTRKAMKTLPSDFRVNFTHTFAFRAADSKSRADFYVVEDEIQLHDHLGRLMYSRSATDGNVGTFADGDENTDSLVYPFNEPSLRELFNERVHRTTTLMSEQFQYPNVFFLVSKALAGLRVFQLSPYQCRLTGVSTPNAALHRHGDNLPAAADHLMRSDPRAWRRVEESMRTIVPGISTISVRPADDRRLALQFREDGLERPWSTGEVSDGTIQALALFVALFDERTPVLAIEEPENSIHPWILRHFVRLCQESKTKQVILTTHSPILLNMVRAESIQLMSLFERRSELRPLTEVDPTLGQLVLSGEMGPFDLYDSGLLPSAVPSGLAP